MLSEAKTSPVASSNAGVGDFDDVGAADGDSEGVLLL